MGSLSTELSQDGSVYNIVLSGRWVAHEAGLNTAALELDKIGPKPTIRIDCSAVESWDSSFVAALFKLRHIFAASSGTLELHNVPAGAQKLFDLATAVPERAGARRVEATESLLVRIGRSAVSGHQSLQQSLAFIGELCTSMLRLVRGRAQMPISDVWRTIESCGPGALPIVTLISFLVGLILAFIGAQQLQKFGATIYVANLVGVGMAREMGAIMVAVIMAGRTGAAFAAQLGTMQVNEEIDALKTFGFSPMEFLVLPRVLALILMMPILCIYSDLIGVLGGTIVSALLLDISIPQYLAQTQKGVLMADVWVGVVKSGIFGVLVAITGCMRGLSCERSASAVGEAVTGAVVSGIVAIVVADAVCSIICVTLGF